MKFTCLYIPGRPVPKGRPRFDRRTGRAYTPKKTKLYQDRVQLYARSGRLKSFNKARMSVFLRLRMVRRKGAQPDVDNLAKAICDALNGIAYHDDAQIDHMTITRVWVSSTKDEGASAHMRPCTEGDVLCVERMMEKHFKR